MSRKVVETIETFLRGASDIEVHLDDIPAFWTKAKLKDLPYLILLTKNKSKSASSTVTIHVWSLGRIGIIIIVQCVEKEGMCSISIDANATQPATSKQHIERAMCELLETRLEMN